MGEIIYRENIVLNAVPRTAQKTDRWIEVWKRVNERPVSRSEFSKVRVAATKHLSSSSEGA